MLNFLYSLIEKYSHNGILLDTNILLLYYVGQYNPDLIEKYKRTCMFIIKDYYLLEKLIQNFHRIISTPNILTELNSFCNQLDDKNKQGFLQNFKLKIDTIHEKYIPSKEIAEKEIFIRFGLTDTGIVDTIKDKYLLLTDDFRLAQYLTKNKVDVINFNHIRPLNW
jgi:rRNA-processing protein FCF1